MAKKKKEAPGGAPEWMVTFGDMMSLLLCFFVIIVSMSEIKQEERFMEVMESIKRAFGYRGGVGFVPALVPPGNTFQPPMPQIIPKKFQLAEGKTKEEGIEGINPSVQTVRKGTEYIIGGLVNFELGKADLLEQYKKQLDSFAENIKGMNNKIRVRGHTARISPNDYRPFASLEDLSYARAKAVAGYLIQKGIRPERITLEACGDKEPVRAQAYDEDSRALNSRVSIILTEKLVDEYKGETMAETGGMIDG